MEIGLDPAIPTYSGGLGILSGDTLRSAFDLGMPLVGVTLLYHKGYLRQSLDSRGNQSEAPVEWNPEDRLLALPQRAAITIEGRTVWLRAWRYLIGGDSGGDSPRAVPVYFLDTDLSQNSPWDRSLTESLYAGDSRYRIAQEAVLGQGGVAMLRALGHTRIDAYHMNEGHASLLTLALLREECQDRYPHGVTVKDVEAVRSRCVFTTHTPVAAGRDEFPLELARQTLGEAPTYLLEYMGVCPNGRLDMSRLGLTLSRYTNGVSRSHGEVSRDLYPGYLISSITNGVHAPGWTVPSFSSLYDRRIPEWRADSTTLCQASRIPLEEIRQAHGEAKARLLEEVLRLTGVCLDETAMTIGFARRATAYKRADLLFTDPDRLQDIASRMGPIQVLYAGKAHPNDEDGKAMIRRVFEAAGALAGAVRVIYLEDYGMDLGRLMCGGVDLWLNTPQRPLEASGTSGMKASLNGVPSLSVLDGWWVEGHREGVTGWSIGEDVGPEDAPEAVADSLYRKLERIVLGAFYQRPDDYAQVMRSSIALNGSYFNTHRMLTQYQERAYTTIPQG